MNDKAIRYKGHELRFLPLGTNGANGVLIHCTPLTRTGSLGGHLAVPARVAALWASAIEIALQSEGDIPDAARRIASYTEGPPRANVYAVAKLELTRCGERLQALLMELGRIVDLIDDLPLNDDGTRELPPGMLDRAREIAAIAHGMGNPS